MASISLKLRTTQIPESNQPQQQQGLVLDDFDLSDSDREDYHNNVDILFVLDTTSSMSTYIQQSILTIQSIIDKFSKMEFDLKFSLCIYRDHPPQDKTYVTEFYNLVSAKKMVEILLKIKAQGGGDFPEAVMDGLREGLSQTSWRMTDDEIQTISKRFLFHICDAPPHGIEYGGMSSDYNWKQNGCPCGTKKEDINKLLKKHKVDYHLIKATKELNQMEKLFKECFGENYAETIELMKSIKPQQQLLERKGDDEKADYLIHDEVVTMSSGIVSAIEKKLF